MDQYPQVTFGRASIHLIVVGNIKPATMSNPMKTSSQWRQRNFPIIQEERSTQSPVVLRRAYQKRLKSQFGSANQRNLCWLKLKPDIQTILESETDGPEHDTGNPKTQGVNVGIYRGVTLFTTSLHLMPLSVLPPFTGSFRFQHTFKQTFLKWNSQSAGS